MVGEAGEQFRPTDLDDLETFGRVEATKNYNTDSFDHETFGKVRNTEVVQAAADVQNRMVNAGLDPEGFLPGRNHGAQAEEMGKRVAGPDATREQIDAAAHGAQAKTYHIEDYQKIFNEADAKRQAESEKSS